MKLFPMMFGSKSFGLKVFLKDYTTLVFEYGFVHETLIKEFFNPCLWEYHLIALHPPKHKSGS
jgi:hypothetical protein